MTGVKSVIDALKTEEKKLAAELGKIRSAISMLEFGSGGGAASVTQKGRHGQGKRRGRLQKRRISAAGRRAISRAQKARWAKLKREAKK